MPVLESEQVTKLNLDTVSQSWLDPNDLGARQRVAKYNFNTTDDLKAGETLAEADIVLLTRIPAGSMIYGIKGYTEAMGTDQFARIGIRGADGSGTYDSAGTADNQIFFTGTLASDGIDVAAAAVYEVGLTQLDNFGYLTTKDVYITLTLFDSSSSDAFAADKDFDGIVFYTDNT